MDECKPLVRGQPAHYHGSVVQVDPMKPVLKAPGCKYLKLKHDKRLSSFGFKFNLRRYTMGIISGMLIQNSLKYMLHFGQVTRYLAGGGLTASTRPTSNLLLLPRVSV